mmetsp:Transcript_7242/g.9827  ORF Transcript_7242/g.9827 Transcript_7242/m.9827 type:complete len:237 (+) Transcript_7242:147-857(+)
MPPSSTNLIKSCDFVPPTIIPFSLASPFSCSNVKLDKDSSTAFRRCTHNRSSAFSCSNSNNLPLNDSSSSSPVTAARATALILGVAASTDFSVDRPTIRAIDPAIPSSSRGSPLAAKNAKTNTTAEMIQLCNTKFTASDETRAAARAIVHGLGGAEVGSARPCDSVWGSFCLDELAEFSSRSTSVTRFISRRACVEASTSFSIISISVEAFSLIGSVSSAFSGKKKNNGLVGFCLV